MDTIAQHISDGSLVKSKLSLKTMGKFLQLVRFGIDIFYVLETNHEKIFCN